MIKSVTKMFTESSIVNKNESFKQTIPFNKRVEEANKVLEKYPNRIPIIVERGSNTVKQINRKKYLVPHDLSVGQFMHVIRQRINLDSSEAIYLFCNGKITPTSKLLSELYSMEQSEDKFLYFQY